MMCGKFRALGVLVLSMRPLQGIQTIFLTPYLSGCLKALVLQIGTSRWGRPVRDFVLRSRRH